MKTQFSIIASLAVLFFCSGCSVVEGIFEAGMGVGIFIVLAVIALVVFLVVRIGKKK
jgi:hypothetical protein